MKMMYFKNGKVIFYIDVNVFYVFVEIVYDYMFKDKFFVIVGNLKEWRGIVVICNYIVCNCGVYVLMFFWEVKRKCFELVVIKFNFLLYC